jgi:hypothetical protein
MRRSYEEPGITAADQQLREVARILAIGLLRLNALSALPATTSPPGSPKNLELSGRACLEFPPETVLSGHVG